MQPYDPTEPGNEQNYSAPNNLPPFLNNSAPSVNNLPSSVNNRLASPLLVESTAHGFPRLSPTAGLAQILNAPGSETVKRLAERVRDLEEINALDASAIEGLQAVVQAQNEHIEALGNLIEVKDERIALLLPFEQLYEELREGSMTQFERMGLHFRQIADTAQNCQVALGEYDPREIVPDLYAALQAIKSCGHLLADAIAEGKRGGIHEQLMGDLEEPESGEETT